MSTSKILFIALMIVTCWFTADAQVRDRWSIGPRVGVNFANVSNIDDSKSVTGLVLGLTSTYSLNENSGITLEGLYSVEGYESPGEEYHLNYLQFPLYFNYFFGQLGDRFRPKVYIGVAPKFFLSGKLNEGNTNDVFFNKFLLDAVGGLGFNYRLGSRIWLNTDVRSFIGLSDIRAKDYQVNDQIAPRNVQLSVGLAYGISKLD